MRDVESIALAQQFRLRDKDMVYVSNAPSVHFQKVLAIFNASLSPFSSTAAAAVIFKLWEINGQTHLSRYYPFDFPLAERQAGDQVDRVGLAYVAHYQALYGERVQAVLSWRGRVGVLPPAESAQVFRQLLHDNQHGANVWFWRKLLLLKLGAFRRPDPAYAGSYLLQYRA